MLCAVQCSAAHMGLCTALLAGGNTIACMISAVVHEYIPVALFGSSGSAHLNTKLGDINGQARHILILAHLPPSSNCWHYNPGCPEVRNRNGLQIVRVNAVGSGKCVSRLYLLPLPVCRPEVLLVGSMTVDLVDDTKPVVRQNSVAINKLFRSVCPWDEDRLNCAAAAVSSSS